MPIIKTEAIVRGSSDGPIYVTKNGYGDMVIMSKEHYENIMQKQSMYNDIAISEKQIENGNIKDAKDSLQNIREKYNDLPESQQKNN